MSLHRRELPPVPEETMGVARAAFPRGNIDRRMRDELGSINDDQLFACLFRRAVSRGEGTHMQAIRPCGLRQSRDMGMARKHLQHLLTAVALNVVWLGAWWRGTSPA
jgi:hypothetical protein